MSTHVGKMQKEEYLFNLHNEILTIMDNVAALCEEKKLKYYLIGGTLLGAVRHKGFIPWDDDLDIIMPRQDYERFVCAEYKNLSEDFYLEWFNTNRKYNHVFAKVCKKNTLFEESVGNNTTIKRGIFIDIFPMDLTDGYSQKIERRKKKVLFWSGILFRKSYSKEKKWLKKIIYILIPTKFSYYMTRYYMQRRNKSTGSYYSNFGSQYSIKRQTHPIDDFGNGILLPFENRKYRCPDRYVDVLTRIFGLNYMELPPEDKRRTHYPVRVIFSNGDKVSFGKTVNKIVVDQD